MPEKVEASVRVWRDGAAEYAAHLRKLNLDAGMYDALHRLFAAGVEAGRGERDWTSIADLTTTGDDSPARERARSLTGERLSSGVVDASGPRSGCVCRARMRTLVDVHRIDDDRTMCDRGQARPRAA